MEGKTGSIGITTDSDGSVESNSLSADSTAEQNQTVRSKKLRKKSRRGSEWEIIEGLKEGQRFDNKPSSYSGYLHKKRKWPLKGWHKRFFMLDKGILVYGKGPAEISKGKLHGSVDIGLSVISTKRKRRRIDIDAEEFIYHLKAKTEDAFNGWVQQLTVNRLYRQHVLTYGANIGTLFKSHDGLQSVPRTPEIVSRDGSLTRGLNPPNGKNCLNFWFQDSQNSADHFQRESASIDLSISRLSNLLEQIQLQSVTLETAVDNVSHSAKKDRRKFGLKKKKSSKGGSVDLTIQFSNKAVPPPGTDDNISPLSANSFSGISNSTQINSAIAMSLPIPSNVPAPDSLSNTEIISLCTEYQLRDDFIAVAKSVLIGLKSLAFALTSEKERLKNVFEAEMSSSANQSLMHLRNNFKHVVQQNMELRNRLIKIHDIADTTDISTIENYSENRKPCNTSLSYSSSCESHTDFFDAEDLPFERGLLGTCDIENEVQEEESEVRTRSESSSEGGSLSSGEESFSSESELEVELGTETSPLEFAGAKGLTGRRTVLPCPRPITEGLSLWNLLSRNIGKDLSQISMPVALNEPLNVLQRLCEELEYSELLDKASSVDDPYERMVYIASFAVSAYASTLSRAGNKPFNPLLGETYECIREDKGFRFLSEQVSHHPPISTCQAESSNFTFWQDARVKTKFWGKSMEFQPLGNVHVMLPRTGDHYTWNKVTTCVHNLFSGQRWVDQYGELKISNDRISCKLTFSKASYWSSKRHEVVGAVYDEAGKPVKRLFGKWSESIYCGVAPSARCIWRAGTLPPNHERYYGFTQFAIELNELGSDAHLLPPTDTRFRPDQRALEEGDLSTAESLKSQLEGAQRERRKRREELNIEHVPRWFSCGANDTWQYNGKYWEFRKNPGFANLQFETLW